MSSAEELDLVRTTARGVLAGGPTDLIALAELGFLGLLVDEADGGAGWLPVEAAVVADEVGRAVSIGGAAGPDVVGGCAPWLATTVAAAALAAAGGHQEQLATTLDGTAPAVAVAGRLEVTGGRASGVLVGVDLPAVAPAIVVIGPAGELHLVDTRGAGVVLRDDPTSIDTTRLLQRIELTDAEVVPLGASTAVRDAAWVLAAASTVGTLRAAVDRLVPYLSQRIAFGSPIASFQAIQHRIVDLTLLEIRAGVAIDAAARVLSADPACASRLAATAHALAVEHVPPALDECIQLTGGIGFTWEYPLHHELRRSVADGTTFGSARQSREVLLEVAGWV